MSGDCESVWGGEAINAGVGLSVTGWGDLVCVW